VLSDHRQHDETPGKRCANDCVVKPVSGLVRSPLLAQQAVCRLLDGAKAERRACASSTFTWLHVRVPWSFGRDLWLTLVTTRRASLRWCRERHDTSVPRLRVRQRMLSPRARSQALAVPSDWTRCLDERPRAARSVTMPCRRRAGQRRCARWWPRSPRLLEIERWQDGAQEAREHGRADAGRAEHQQVVQKHTLRTSWNRWEQAPRALTRRCPLARCYATRMTEPRLRARVEPLLTSGGMAVAQPIPRRCSCATG
jgi:hypothetical protein